MKNVEKLSLVVIFSLISLFASLEYTSSKNRFAQQPMTQMDFYSGYAWNLVQGNGYIECVLTVEYLCDLEKTNYSRMPQAYRVPGYPLFIASAMLVDIENFMPYVILIQSVLLSAIVGLTVGWAYQWDRLASIITGIQLLVSFHFYEIASLMLSEIWFTFLFLLTTILLARAKTQFSFLIYGLMMGSLMLTRGVLLFTLPLIFLWIKPKRYLILILFAMSVVILPWAIRNYIVFDAFVPFSTGSGQVLSGSNNPIVYKVAPGTWQSYRWEADADVFSTFTELERDQSLRYRAIEYIQSLDLQELLTSVLLKLFGLFGVYDNPQFTIGLLISISIVLMTIYRSMRQTFVRHRMARLFRQPTIKLFAILMIGLLLNTFVFWGNWRFRLPYEPYIAIFSGMLVANIFNNE